MLSEKEYKETLIEYLDSLRPQNSKWRGKVTCQDCNHLECMFQRYCDVEAWGATLICNAHNFNKMLEKWKERKNEINVD